MGLRDLPVKPNISGIDECVSAYFDELKKISLPDELKAHTNRWKAIWELEVPQRNEPITLEEKSIIDGTYDVNEALECISKSFTPGNGCAHVHEKNIGKSCVGMFISMPLAILFATMASQRFGVCIDLALVQMCGGVGELLW